MLLRLRKNASRSDVESVLATARELGYETRFLDSGRQVLEARCKSGAGGPADRSRFEDLACVRSVLDASDAPELADRTAERPSTAVRVGGASPAVFGGGCVSLIAGPCAVEDEERLLEVARAVRRAGATCLRGGAYKPRTSPYSFQGLGPAGLERLARAKAEVGIAIVTEVLDPREVERVAEVADMFQIGSRSMTNFALLKEVGQARKPVLLKRGFAARGRELLLAAEYVLSAGNPDVVLCERGIRGFDDVTRNVLDLGLVAWLKKTTHLPVIVDPSHAAGRADLVPALSRAAIAAGADGLIIEVHPEPSEVHSDGAQAISIGTFERVVADVGALLELDGRTLIAPEPELALSGPRDARHENGESE
ncbi:MAG: 3-deoxy-7-phosphoheptulonate synthase [Planctomycetota bacterium]|nr:3-deoxy-7-phosphoheptulonate synthase [Planctomycetota bacterium]